MKRFPACLLFMALAAPAQENAAAKALKEKMDRLNFLQLAARRPKFIGQAGPKVCSIPLLNAPVSPNTEKMPVLNPPFPPDQREWSVQLPAPPCR